MQYFFQEIRQALRALLRSPTYSAVAVGTLAVGIGWTTAVFSALSAVLIDPLPYPNADELVVVGGQVEGLGSQDLTASAPEYRDYAEQSTRVAELAAYWVLDVNVTGVDQPFRSRDAIVTWNFLSMLGREPALGRNFTAEDAGGDIGHVAILSHAAWVRYFGEDREVIGSTILIDDDPIEIIGVMPRGFVHPGDTPDNPVEMWGPIDISASSRFGQGRNARQYTLIGRLSGGAGIEAAQSEFDVIATGLRQSYPAAYPAEAGWSTRVVPLKERLVGHLQPSLVLIFVAAGFVLLIACLNVANLMLARGAVRARSIAVRGALGASRIGQARHIVWEGVVIGIAGGALGIAMAAAGTGLIRSFASTELPRIDAVSVDGRVLLFCLALTVGTCLVVAVVPALRLTRVNLHEVLRSGGRWASAGHRSRSALVIAEISFSIVLLVGSGLTLKSYRSLMGVELGFEAASVMTLRTYFPWTIVPQNGRYFDVGTRIGFFDEAIRRLEEIPDVESAGIITQLPLRRLNGTAFSLQGSRFESSSLATNAEFRQISPDYFEVMEIPVRSGRAFNDRDDTQRPLTVIVDQAWVDRFSPDESALGRQVRLGGNPAAPWREIVGVVGNVRQHGLDALPRETIYASYRQGISIDAVWVIRSRGAAEDVTQAAVATLGQLDPTLPVFARVSMEEVVQGTVAEQRVVTSLLTLFAIQAVLLAALGIYGVMSQFVAQRVREIGIRMALGAERASVIGLVVASGSRLGIAGVVLGVGLAALFARLLRTILFEVEPLDPMVYLTVALATLVVAAGSSLIPALRAARTDPARVLAAE